MHGASVVTLFMNAKSIIIASMLGAAGLALAAESVDVGQLPRAVRKTIDASAGGETVKQITIQNVDGRDVYIVEFERRNAPNPTLRITADGQVLRSTSALDPTKVSAYPDYAPDTTPIVPTLSLADVPEPVQQTIKKAAAGREIAAINAETLEGRKAYAVQFREPGRNPRLSVAEDGTIMRPTEKPPALIVGTTFADTPAVVQQAIRREARDGEILKIDKEGRRGEADVYRVDLRDTRGVYQIRVSKEGNLLENTRATDRPTDRG